MSGGSGGSSAGATGVSLTAKGDLLTFNTSETRLPVSATNGQVLTTNSAVADGIEWATASSGGAKSFFVNSFDGHIGTSSQFQNLGGRAPQGIEADGQVYLPLAFTWSNLSTNCMTYTADVSPTIKSRDDGVTGNQVITITATGQFEDVSNSDTVSANSLCNYISGGEPTSGKAFIINLTSVCEI